MRKLAIAAAALVLLGGLTYLLYPWGSDPASSPGSSPSSSSGGARQRDARRAGTADARPASVAGRVIDEQGRPIPGAIVSITMRNLARGERSDPGDSPQPLIATTGKDGRWSADRLVPGRYTVSGAARRYLPATVDPLIVRQGEARGGVDLVLGSGGHTLSGTVSDIGGGPVDGALVRATSIRDGNVFHLFRAPFTTMTGGDGRYEITLADGAYLLEVLHADYVTDERWSEIRGGDRVEDFTLTPGGVVFGQVRRRGTDEPVAGATVTRSGGSGEGRGFDVGNLVLSGSVTDGDGAFVLRGLESGALQLRAFGPGCASREPTEVQLGVAEQLTGIVIYVDTAYSISGTVVDKRSPDRGIDGVLVGAYNLSGAAHLARDASAEDGFFEIHGVQDGSYIVGAAGEDRVAAVVGKNVTVAGANLTDVVVELDAGATLSGRVEPPTSARIGLDMDTESIGPGNFTVAIGAAAVSARSAADGTFALRGVPAGKFTLVAHADDGAEGKLPVEVTGADQAGLVLKLAERARISGTVVDGRGRPVAGLRVDAEPRAAGHSLIGAMSSLWGRGRGTTRADGSFEVAGLSPGVHQVSVSDDGGGLTLVDGGAGRRDQDDPGPRTSVDATIDGSTPVTGLRLVVETRDGTIRGVVVTPGGAPVPDAWVTARRVDQPAATAAADKGAADMGATVKVETDEEANDRRRQRRWGPSETPVLSGPDRRFDIRRLRVGEYDVEAEGHKGTARGVVEGVQVGANVSIRIEPLAGITGRVTRAGKPVTSYRVEAEGPMARTAQVVAPDGSYRLTRLDPGSYRISVMAQDGRATGTVEVVANQVAHRDLELLAHGSVRGVLVDASTGKPMAGLPVLAYSDDGADTESLAMSMMTGNGPRTEADGRFRVGRLGSGKGTVIVIDRAQDGFETVAQRAFTIEAGQDLDLGTLRGKPASTVPEDQRGELGMDLVAAAWADRPRPPGQASTAAPPGGIDGETTHLWVSSVEEGGPAAAGGVRVGDRIVAAAGVEVSVVGAAVAEALLSTRRLQVGKPVSIKLELDGSARDVTLTPEPPIDEE